MIEDLKLTIRECEGMGEARWFVIERAAHDGRSWWESTGHNSASLRLSSRFSDADVEGTAAEMLAVAEAIEAGKSVSFKRCSAYPTLDGAGYEFSSPRNSTVDGVTSKACALDLAQLIRATLTATNDTTKKAST